ncbi:MAG: ComEC/Rec2 family competence protein [Muribaculaceae bacterium]|nr:ComEC/Rec2 family competence protein [Muribaculaceae bacterium]
MRLLLPVMLGIMLNTVCPGYLPIALMAASGVVLYAVLLRRGSDALSRLRVRRLWIVSVSLLAAAVGALSLQLYRPQPLDLHQANGSTAVGQLETVTAYDYAMRLQVRLLALDGQSVDVRRVLLSTRGCDYSLREGDVVAFDCQLSPITNLGNPDEYDRESHLWQHGILYSQHLPVSQLRVIGHRPTLLSWASSARRWLESRLLATSLSVPCQELLSALLLGDSRQLSPAVRSRFSQAGIAHILALSGLHVGLLTSLIWFLLFPLDYLRLRRVRLLFTLLTLTAFALITGLSPSVVRATIMIGFTLVALVLYRKSVALNALCVSALLTLCIWPTALYQAGFQLSYVTVAAVLTLPGHLLPTGRGHRWWRYVCSLVLTSLVAMSATIMLTAYYFCSISVLSVLSNVLILPVMPVLMVLGVVFLFLAGLELDCDVLNSLIEWIYSYMNTVSQAVSSLPWAHIGGVYVTWGTVLLYYVALLCVVLWLLTRRSRWLPIALAVCVAGACQLLWLSWRTPAHCLIVLNDYRSTPIVWHTDGQTYAWLPDEPTADRQLFEYTHRRLLAHLGGDSVRWVDDSVRMGHSVVHSPLALIDGRLLLVAGKDTPRSWLQQAGTVGPVDLLVVTTRYHRPVSELTKVCRPGVVVLSGGAQATARQSQLASCTEQGLPYHDLKQQGAFVLR